VNLTGAAAVVLHPHPSMGGDSSHRFVVEVATRLEARGVRVATPDLRDPNVAEAAPSVDAIANALDAERVILVGYSWGSVVASHASPAGLAARVLVAPPVSMGLGDLSAVPALVLAPENDQYGGPDATKAVLSAEPRVTIEVVPGADHFLWGSIGPIVGRIVDWLNA
jgi:alpha/beta superfamily hydrolase